MDYHNFALEHYYNAEPVDYEEVLEQALEWGRQIAAWSTV